jgi:hypothetical protein
MDDAEEKVLLAPGYLASSDNAQTLAKKLKVGGQGSHVLRVVWWTV